MRNRVHTGWWVGALLLLSAQALTESWVHHTVAEGRLRVELPAALRPLSDEVIRQKYPAQSQAADYFSDSTVAVNFVFSLTQQPMTPEQIDGYRRALATAIPQRVPGTVVHDSRLVPFGGQQAALIEFTSPVPDDAIRNLMMIASLDGRMLLITFNVTRSLEAEWLETGRQVLNSVRLADPAAH